MTRFGESFSLRSFCFSIALLAFLIIGREATAAQLTVTWGDASSNEDGFKIERKTGTTGTFAQIGTAAVNTTTYLNSNIPDGMTYCYRVRAYNAAGDSAFSNEACGSTPIVPFALSVTKSGNGQGTVTSSPAGISCGSDCSESYTSTTSVTLSAAPTAGSSFSGWSGSGCSGTGTCTLLMNTSTSVTATFTAVPPTTYTLSVTKVGSGTVTSSPAGITCGADCSEPYTNGTVVSLTATPATGYSFSGWSGACTGTGACAVTLNAAKTVTATFTATTSTTYTLSVTKVGSGTVTSSPAGISCGTDCSEPYANGTVVALTATPTSGYTFSGWSGACTGTGACAVTLNAAKSVTATFTTGTGLVAAYSFNASGGATVADVSGNNNTGTISGAAWTTMGKFGTALSFDGINDWVTINDANSLDLTSRMTLEAWVHPTALNGGSTNGWRSVILKQTTNGLAYSLYANDDTNRPSGYVAISGDQGVFGPTQLALNTWTHLATTYDGSRQRLYINGVEVANRAQSGTIATSSGVLRLGGNSVWGEYFQGRIDEVRIYNRALTATQIQTDMNTAVTP